MYQTIPNEGLSYRQLSISNTLRSLWNEHVLLTRLFILSTVFNLPDLQFATEKLMQNPIDFARALTQFYGERTAMQFRRLLTNHLAIAGQFVNAAKAGDTVAKDRQRRRWYINAGEIARLLASINPLWSEREWRHLLFDHLRRTEDEAVYLLVGQYAKSITEYDGVQAEALNMADVMTGGIIRQFHV